MWAVRGLAASGQEHLGVRALLPSDPQTWPPGCGGVAFFPRSGPPQGCWLNLAPPSAILMDPQGQEGKWGAPEGAPSPGGQGLLTGQGAVRGAAQVARELSPTQQHRVSCEGDPPVIGPPCYERGTSTVTDSREVWGHTPGPPDPSPGLVRGTFLPCPKHWPHTPYSGQRELGGSLARGGFPHTWGVPQDCSPRPPQSNSDGVCGLWRSSGPLPALCFRKSPLCPGLLGPGLLPPPHPRPRPGASAPAVLAGPGSTSPALSTCPAPSLSLSTVLCSATPSRPTPCPPVLGPHPLSPPPAGSWPPALQDWCPPLGPLDPGVRGRFVVVSACQHLPHPPRWAPQKGAT